MPDFITYNIKAAGCIAVFYIFYKLLLSRETFHGLKRAVLIVVVLLSFLLPSGIVTIRLETAPPAPLKATRSISWEAEFPEPTVPTAEASGNHSNDFPTEAVPVTGSRPGKSAAARIPTVIFWFGAVAAMICWLLSLLKVLSIIRGGERIKSDHGFVIIKKEQDIVPFSWIRYIVISNQDYAEHGGQIVAHETAHLRLGHSWDLLMLDLAGCLQWFNPTM